MSDMEFMGRHDNTGGIGSQVLFQKIFARKINGIRTFALSWNNTRVICFQGKNNSEARVLCARNKFCPSGGVECGSGRAGGLAGASGGGSRAGCGGVGVTRMGTSKGQWNQWVRLVGDATGHMN